MALYKFFYIALYCMLFIVPQQYCQSVEVDVVTNTACWLLWHCRHQKTSCSVCCAARQWSWISWAWLMSDLCQLPMTSCPYSSLCWSSLALRLSCRTFSTSVASTRSGSLARSSTGGCSSCQPLNSSRQWITQINAFSPVHQQSALDTSQPISGR